MELNTKNLTLEQIIEFCKEHNDIAWLKETAAKKVPVEVYPKTKAPKIDPETGEQLKSAKGKPLFVSVPDTTKEPTVEMRPISFIQLKSEFMAHFALGEPKNKKPTMYDIIAAL